MTTNVLDGVRIVEVAMWTFVPTAGAVLAEWGADVVKIEHPVTGDAQRGLINSKFLPQEAGGVNYMMEVPNRGKRSFGLDLASDEGKELLYELCKTADVFLTNFLPDARQKLGIELEDIRKHNPKIIYARGHGAGVRGPDAHRGGFDSSSYWARGGIGYTVSPPGEYPVRMRSAFGDVMGGLTIAGGLAAALFRRERTGEPSVVDVSLLNLAMWNISVDMASAGLFPDKDVYRYDPEAMINPTVGMYATKDGRHLNLTMLQSDRYWTELVTAMGRPDLIADPRFESHELREKNALECTQELKDVFLSKTVDEWREVLADIEGVWSPLQTPQEVHVDPQAIANGYLPVLDTASGGKLAVVANPVQFDEEPASPVAAPELGQHTEEILLGMGRDWGQIIELKDRGVIT
ncbi:CaiB/BaiF CoA transferase family protein [Nocardioides massiliensis]|uniref:Crotonobetainyl-CoA:carnitine CoA-transferase CaiB-like acyl-CoA transferase n=1 Tax=Nocardioides massiliensis TaxID=1325935 RepID=A0ABT9NK23_9ACTN|nr:CoA transferase [Nocardioides massiliensis]MDP9820765.1 crotonobetainyl-CoA:carnitine CoA-transferase CaiB-like acyl-CoA transferase [Nocardioides massiliensis]